VGEREIQGGGEREAAWGLYPLVQSVGGGLHLLARSTTGVAPGSCLPTWGRRQGMARWVRLLLARYGPDFGPEESRKNYFVFPFSIISFQNLLHCFEMYLGFRTKLKIQILSNLPNRY
jgi:hypothetical protein